MSSFLVNTHHVEAISKKDLTGTWMWCDNFGNPQSSEYNGMKTIRYKVMAESSMVWIEVDQNTNIAYMLYFGSYDVVKGKFIETSDYTSEGLEGDRGFVNHFDMSIKNGVWHVKGIDNSYDEVWKKTKSFKVLK